MTNWLNKNTTSATESKMIKFTSGLLYMWMFCLYWERFSFGYFIQLQLQQRKMLDISVNMEMNDSCIMWETGTFATLFILIKEFKLAFLTSAYFWGDTVKIYNETCFKISGIKCSKLKAPALKNSLFKIKYCTLEMDNRFMRFVCRDSFLWQFMYRHIDSEIFLFFYVGI